MLFRISLFQTHKQMQGYCRCCSGFPSFRHRDRCREIVGVVQACPLPDTDRCREIVGVVQDFPLPDTQADAGKLWLLFKISLFQSHRQMQGNCGCCSGFPSSRHTDMQGNCRYFSGFPSPRQTDRCREYVGVVQAFALPDTQLDAGKLCVLFRISLFQTRGQMQGNCGCCSVFPSPRHTDRCREIVGVVQAFPLLDT